MSTEKLWWHVAVSITHQIALHVPAGLSPVLKAMAMFSGQHYITISDPLLTQPHNIDSLIMGITSSSYWLHLQDSFLRMTINCLTMVSQAYQNKH